MGKSIFVRVLVLCVALYFVYSLSALWSDLIKGRATLDATEKQIADTEITIGEYKELLSEGNEAKIIEKAARERLGYIYSNEQLFIDYSGS